MMVKGIIFDANGPLYYRDRAVVNLKIELLKKFGYSGDYGRFFDSYGKVKWLGYTREISNIGMFKQIFDDMGLDDTSLKDFISEFYKIHKKIKQADGAAETLKKLKNNGLRICVLTDSYFPEKDKWGWFKSIGMDKHIDAIVSSYNIKKLKDTKEAYGECLKKMKLKPSEVVFVGHKQYEMVGAKKVNIPSIAILPISEENIKADFKVQSITELPELLGKVKVP